MTPRSDDIHLRQVIAGFLRGDSEQHQIIKRQIARLVDRWYSGRADDREDLVADTLKTLLENLRGGQFRGESLKSFNSYIYGITNFKVLRAVQRANSAEHPHDPEVMDQLPLTGLVDQQTEVADRQLVQRIYRAINPKCRELLELKFSMGWSDQEIADHRNMTKNAVSTAISRCIRRAQTLDFVREILYQNPPYRHYEERGGERGMH
jgi:RNA polymerase sigma-70 factor (ECF subfamily)